MNRLGRFLQLFAVCLAWGIAGISPAMGAPVMVGFSVDTLDNDFRLAQLAEMRKAVESRPDIQLVVRNAQNDTARQAMDVANLLDEGVRILIINPRDRVALAPAINKAHQAGVPVILLLREVDGARYTTWIGSDDRAIGRAAARLLAGELEGKGNILMIRGVPTSSTAQDRTSGFLEEIRRHPGIAVTAIKDGHYVRSATIQAMQEVLESGVEFDAIFAQSDSMASGARMALKKAGINPGSKRIVGIDFISEARQAIIRGEQLASFVYRPGGKEAIQSVINLLAGTSIPHRQLLPTHTVTRANARQSLPVF